MAGGERKEVLQLYSLTIFSVSLPHKQVVTCTSADAGMILILTLKNCLSALRLVLLVYG